MMWTVCEMSANFLLSVFIMKNVYVTNLKPIEDRDKNCLECGMLNFNVLSHLLSRFMIEVANQMDSVLSTEEFETPIAI